MATAARAMSRILDVYGFVLAGLLLTMGSLADRVGHRRVLMWGAVGFGAASILAAFAPTASLLILARAVLAVSGATLMPSTLALIRHIFVDDTDRAKAIATWNAVLAGGVTVGPIISGVLLEHFWWGAVFLINVPVMAALLVVAPLLLPGDTAVANRRIDLASALLMLGAMLPTIYAIKEFAADGWSMVRGGALVVGLACGAMFVVRQRQLDDPMIELRLFGDRRFSVSIWTNVVCMFALLGNSIVVTQYLQSVLGYSPLTAALWSIAPSVLVAVTAPLAALASARWGRPTVMIVGLLTGAVGFGVLGGLLGVDTLLVALVGSTLLATGIVSASSVVADYVMGVAPAHRTGATSGLLETSSELGGAIGIAVIGSVVNLVYRMTFPAHLTIGETSSSLAGAIATARHLDAGQASSVVNAARSAFVDGASIAAFVGAGVLVVTALLVGWMRRTTRATGSQGSVDRGVDHSGVPD